MPNRIVELEKNGTLWVNDIIDAPKELWNKGYDRETIVAALLAMQGSVTGLSTLTKKGVANEILKVGDEFTTKFLFNDGWGDIIWQILGFNQDKLVEDDTAPTTTLGCKDILFRMSFDSAEAGNPDTNRSIYGNNNYMQSNIRQWLNSETNPFVYVSQHDYDKPPDNYDAGSLAIYNGAGFIARLDPELASVIKPVKKWTSKNHHSGTDGNGDYETTEKVFLLSRKEVGSGTEGTDSNEFVYQLYNGATNADRIKLESNGSAYVWWLRSPSSSISHGVRLVYTDGSMNFHSARSARGLVPACVIG